MMEAVVTTGAISHAKLHPVFLQASCPSCRPTNSVKALKVKYIQLILLPKTFGFVWPVYFLESFQLRSGP